MAEGRVGDGERLKMLRGKTRHRGRAVRVENLRGRLDLPSSSGLNRRGEAH